MIPDAQAIRHHPDQVTRVPLDLLEQLMGWRERHDRRPFVTPARELSNY
jgi:hypothetical protein